MSGVENDLKAFFKSVICPGKKNTESNSVIQIMGINLVLIAQTSFPLVSNSPTTNKLRLNTSPGSVEIFFGHERSGQ